MIPVKCPHCQVGLKVDEKKIPQSIDSFKCPKCKHEIPVSYLKRKEPEDSETVYLQSTRSGKGRLTVLPDANTPEQTFALHEGIHIIGRKASTSAATIAIETGDKKMSRNHIRIEVKKDAKGNLLYMLSDHQSKNRTLYNGKYLDESEVVALKNNDEIKIGDTIVRFHEQQ